MERKKESTIDELIRNLKKEEDKTRREIGIEFKSQIDFSYKVIATIINILTKPNTEFNPQNPLQDVIVFLLVKGVRTARSIITSCENGWGTESQILLRTLLEILINMFYVAKGGPKVAKLFIEYDFVLLEMTLGKKELSRFVADATDEEKLQNQETLLNFERVKSNYPNKYSWSNKTIRKMAKEVGLENDYNVVYFRCSHIVHSSPRSSIDYIELDNGLLRFVLDPSNYFIYLSLVATCEYSIMMLKKAAEVFDELGEIIKQMENELQIVFKPIIEQSSS